MNLTLLKSHLSRLAPVLHTRTTLAVLSCVKLKSDVGFLSIEASNLEQAMRITMPYDGPELACCVSLRRLMQVPGDGEVKIAPAAGKLSIKGSGFSATLSVLPVEEFPPTQTIDGRELVLCGDHTQSLKWVALAVSLDELRYVLNGICFNSLGMCACDGRRAHVAEFQDDLGGIIVPKNCITMIAEMMKPEAVVRWSDSYFSIEADDATLTTKLIGGDYPNIKQVIPDDHGAVWKINTPEMQRALKLLMSSFDATNPVEVSGNGEVISMSVKSRDGQDVVSAEMEGSVTGRFTANLSFLNDFIAGFSGEQSLEVKDVNGAPGQIFIKTPERTAVMMGMKNA